MALHQVPSGENTAKIRVRGFTEYTNIVQAISCSEAHWLGALRNSEHPERKVVDLGYKKANLAEGNALLDYMETTIPINGYIQVQSSMFTSDNQICPLMTPWFKPEKGALYEVRNQLTNDAQHCVSRTWKVDQQIWSSYSDSRSAIYH